MGIVLLAGARSHLVGADRSGKNLRSALALDVAIANVVRDLRCELQAGSVWTSGDENGPCMHPVDAQAALPWKAEWLPPNLLKQSSSNVPFYDPAPRSSGGDVYVKASEYPVSRRAIRPPSADGLAPGTAALTNRASGVRWDAPGLLPVGGGESGDADCVPLREGEARAGGSRRRWVWNPPEWIYISGDGGSPQEWSDRLRANSAQFRNPDAVTMRYAFQLYDVGGLLDLNLAGFDRGRISVEDAARKGGLPFADLSQIGLSPSLQRALLDWRAGQGVQSRFSGAVLSALREPFSPVYGVGWLGPRGELSQSRRFVSRRQMLEFFNRLGGDALERSACRNALQFATHFSRGIEQPSHRPGYWEPATSEWKSPRVVAPAGNTEDKLHGIGVATRLPVSDPRVLLNLPYEMALGNYRGGNDAWGRFSQRGADGERLLQEAINPALSDVRVSVPFLRGSGRPARVGEPLVERRFPLSRLAWVTWKGPSASLPKDDPLYNEAGTPEAVYANFGLRWVRDEGLTYLQSDAPTLPADQTGFGIWRYDHSRPGGAVVSEGIGRLEDVAADGRDPDFFELLKAGVAVGSLGKAAAKMHAGMEGWAHDPATWQQVRDKDPTNQVLEIGACIIDQFDADSFPTLIQIGAQGQGPRGPCFVPTFTARGVENLPYLYRLHWRAIPNSVDPPHPVESKIQEITGRLPAFAEDGFHPGTTSLVAFPEVWNPHLSPARSGAGPLKLRLLAVAEDPPGATGPEGQVRPFFPLLSTRWKTLHFTGTAEDRHAHFTFWPGGAHAFQISTPGKSTKVFFHDRRFSSSYEFFGTSSQADDYHSCRLSTNAPAEPSSYLFWSGAPAGTATRRYAVEGYAYLKLKENGFAPLPAPGNVEPPSAWRGYGFNGASAAGAAAGRPVWFAPADGRVRGSLQLDGPPRFRASDPVSPLVELRNSEIRFSLCMASPELFREPTTLCKKGCPAGSDLDFGPDNFFQGAPYLGVLRDEAGADWIGFSLGDVPSQFIAAQRLVSAEKVSLVGTPERVDATGAPAASGVWWRFFHVPVNLAVQRNWGLMTLRLQYEDPLTSKWITYDEKYVGMDGRMEPDAPPYQGLWNAVPTGGAAVASAWAFPALCFVDPRTSRFGAFQRYAYNWLDAVQGGEASPPKALPLPIDTGGEGVTDRPSAAGSTNALAALGGGPAQFNRSWTRFKEVVDQDPSVLEDLYQKNTSWWALRSLVQPPSLNANDYGWISRYGNPASTGDNPFPWARGFSHFWEDYSHDAGTQESTENGRWRFWGDAFRAGWLSENRAPSAAFPERQAYADPDDVVRRASGAFAATGGYGAALEGLPQGQSKDGNRRSRPVVLDRPFRSVAELGYAFRGAPWKHVDFSTPETGDAALLDLFCVQEPPLEQVPLVAGRVNLNTCNEAVLRALLSGALKDELQASETLSADWGGGEITAAARALVDRTSGKGLARGPLRNVSELAGFVVGRNFPTPGGTLVPNVFTSFETAAGEHSATLYTSVAPSTVTAPYRNPEGAQGAATAWTFSGFGADLDAVFQRAADRKIPRLRESVLRALVDAGQVRVWNLMLDVVVQTGGIPPNAVDVSGFRVESQTRAWVHLAMDRLSGRVVDSQIELVAE